MNNLRHIMANENSPVIVTYQRLNEKVSKALEMKPDAILDAVKSPSCQRGTGLRVE
jgi:hypothetical protein